MAEDKNIRKRNSRSFNRDSYDTRRKERERDKERKRRRKAKRQFGDEDERSY